MPHTQVGVGMWNVPRSLAVNISPSMAERWVQKDALQKHLFAAVLPTYIHPHIHLHTQTRACLGMYEYIHVSVWVWVYGRECMRYSECVRVNVCLRVCVCVCLGHTLQIHTMPTSQTVFHISKATALLWCYFWTGLYVYMMLRHSPTTNRNACPCVQI